MNPKRVRLNMFIDGDQDERLRRASNLSGIPVSELVRLALAAGLPEIEKRVQPIMDARVRGAA